jgi:hypothetical protein
MRFGLPALLFPLLTLGAALPARAEMYKWVDEKGVTNYSSAPPSAKARVTTVAEDRVSVVQADPSWKEAAAISATRPDYATEEWLQRQRLMALKETYTATVYPYPDAYYPAYGYGYGYPVARPRAVRPLVRASLPVATPRATSRGALTR